ncbi:putative high mobility group B protein 11 isoform X2 [Capsella rubella]|uniref:putative high mobility group B protein 11 isoform X2 n=1 Tax=Capsella rubella TaxID=81985 RepID=UPI000CD57A8C|nr:putative high mobility group B protein 11 isoform X2 [Capsella rubella]
MSKDPSQVEVVLANDSSGLEKGDFSRTSMYQILVQNPELFWDRLQSFLESSQGIFKIPIVGGDKLDLHRLFYEVTSRGGLEMDRRCKEVMDAFQFKKTITNAASVLRKHYLKMLFEFEHVYYFKAPLAEFPEREKALMRLVDKSANKDMDVEEAKAGLVFNGKFESGYLVTVKMGMEELKGVIFHMRDQAPPETPRRKKKRAKTSHDYEEKFLEKKKRVNMETVAATNSSKTVAATNAAETVDATVKTETIAEMDEAETVAKVQPVETVAVTNAAETGAAANTTETVVRALSAETVVATKAMEAVAAADVAETVGGTDAAASTSE